MQLISSAIITIVFLLVAQPVFASNNNDNGDNNILHDLGDALNSGDDGNKAGREAARNDYNNGRSHSDTCPSPYYGNDIA